MVVNTDATVEDKSDFERLSEDEFPKKLCEENKMLELAIGVVSLVKVEAIEANEVGA